jgi:hypothetical protein
VCASCKLAYRVENDFRFCCSMKQRNYKQGL